MTFMTTFRTFTHNHTPHILRLVHLRYHYLSHYHRRHNGSHGSRESNIPKFTLNSGSHSSQYRSFLDIIFHNPGLNFFDEFLRTYITYQIFHTLLIKTNQLSLAFLRVIIQLLITILIRWFHFICMVIKW